jgi:hypothetical protein
MLTGGSPLDGFRGLPAGGVGSATSDGGSGAVFGGCADELVWLV